MDKGRLEDSDTLDLVRTDGNEKMKCLEASK